MFGKFDRLDLKAIKNFANYLRKKTVTPPVPAAVLFASRGQIQLKVFINVEHIQTGCGGGTHTATATGTGGVTIFKQL